MHKGLKVRYLLTSSYCISTTDYSRDCRVDLSCTSRNPIRFFVCVYCVCCVDIGVDGRAASHRPKVSYVRNKAHTSYNIVLLQQAGNYTTFYPSYRAPSTTAGCSASCICCCFPVPLSGAPSACVRILSLRLFSITDWYMGSAGRWISITSCGIMPVWRRCVGKGEERRSTHIFETGLGIGSHLRVADEVNISLFAFVWGEVEPCREVTGREMSQP